MHSYISSLTLFTIGGVLLFNPTMSIDRETFENASEDELEELSIPDLVLGFLATYHDRAFKAQEIASDIGVDEGAVSTALSRLKSRALVEHKATYWAVIDDEERLTEYTGYARATAMFNDQLGAEDKEEWKEYAADGPHPSSEAEQ